MWISIEDGPEDGSQLLRCSDDFPKHGAFRFEFYSTRATGEHLMLHRAISDGKLVALIRIHRWFGHVFVGFSEFISPFSPVRSQEVEVCCERPEIWLRQNLLRNGGFGRGTFSVRQLWRPESLWFGKSLLTQASWYEEETETIVPLRAASDPESGRVKWYRKLARQSLLPPVFVFRHEGLRVSLIVDGHDRFLAAHLEEVVPDVWEISRVRASDAQPPDEIQERENIMWRAVQIQAETKEHIDGINRVYQELHRPRKVLHRTLVTAIPGGLEAWYANISERQLPDIFRGSDEN